MRARGCSERRDPWFVSPLRARALCCAGIQRGAWERLARYFIDMRRRLFRDQSAYQTTAARAPGATVSPMKTDLRACVPQLWCRRASLFVHARHRTPRARGAICVLHATVRCFWGEDRGDVRGPPACGGSGALLHRHRRSFLSSAPSLSRTVIEVNPSHLPLERSDGNGRSVSACFLKWYVHFCCAAL